MTSVLPNSPFNAHYRGVPPPPPVTNFRRVPSSIPFSHSLSSNALTLSHSSSFHSHDSEPPRHVYNKHTPSGPGILRSPSRRRRDGRNRSVSRTRNQRARADSKSRVSFADDLGRGPQRERAQSTPRRQSDRKRGSAANGTPAPFIVRSRSDDDYAYRTQSRAADRDSRNRHTPTVNGNSDSRNQQSNRSSSRTRNSHSNNRKR